MLKAADSWSTWSSCWTMVFGSILAWMPTFDNIFRFALVQCFTQKYDNFLLQHHRGQKGEWFLTILEKKKKKKKQPKQEPFCERRVYRCMLTEQMERLSARVNDTNTAFLLPYQVVSVASQKFCKLFLILCPVTKLTVVLKARLNYVFITVLMHSNTVAAFLQIVAVQNNMSNWSVNQTPRWI